MSHAESVRPERPEPMSPRRPRIGLSANLFEPEVRPLFKNKALYVAERSMVEAVQRAGGLAVVVPFPESADELAEWVGMLDGLLLTGGADMAPESYGEEPVDPRWPGQRARDEYELALYHACRQARLPVLGICRGAQVINVAEGGTLWQDIISCRPDSLLHRDPEPYDRLGHNLRVEPSSILAGLFGQTHLWVNSVHHQAVRVVAPNLRATAFAPDGVVEALEWAGPSEANVLAVQWHPEWMAPDAVQGTLFEWLVGLARAGSEEKRG